MSDETTELLSVGDILWNEPCDERIVVIAANERNVWLRKVQKNDELAMHDGHVWAMLGKKCNVNNMCTQSYAQTVFELDGHVEQTISETHGTLTAEQVRDVIERHVKFYEGGDYDEQAIADELNALLGSDAKPCYAADENYKQCKYSVNRGWCDDDPFLVWDDTGHLFITMGGLKTCDVTDDAKKWFAELGSGTCKITATATSNLMYPDYMTKWYELSCGHSLTLKGDEAPKWCAVCGKAVR